MSSQKNYEAEARETWGGTDAYRQYREKTGDYTPENWEAASQGMDAILGQVARCMESGQAPDASQAQALVKSLQDYITAHFYPCTKEILAGLGQMYVADERFQTNIDKHAQGTAAYLSQAIKAWCSQ